MIIRLSIYPQKNENRMKKLIISFFVIVTSTYSLYSQNRTIKGRVISEFFETLIGVPIMINDTIVVGRTDQNGFFHILMPGSVKKIIIKDVGLETAIIEISDTCKDVEVIMLLRATYDFRTPRKVDRLRMKRFKKLPKLHKKAFSKGIFKTDRVCYTQEFAPYYKEKQEEFNK